MIDIATAYNKYKFIGYEFLTWLWFVVENEPERAAVPHQIIRSVQIGNRIVLENPQLDRTERITAKGDSTNFDTGMLSLRQGALVTEMSLVLKGEGHEWHLVIKGENLSLSNLKTPPTAPIELPEDIEGAVLEKAFLLEQVLACIDNLFQFFIKQRISPDWEQRIIQKMCKWIKTQV
jgi:hypothetical protein